MHALKKHLKNATNVCADIKADLEAFSRRSQSSDVNAGAASSASLRHGTGPVLAMEESLPTPQQSSVNDAVLAVEAVIRRFIEEAGCEHIMVSAIAELVHASRGSKANARDGGATDTMTILSGLSQEAFATRLADLLPRALAKQAASTRQSLASRKEGGDIARNSQGDKFTEQPTAAYGTIEDFHASLRKLGLPRNDIHSAMKKECVDAQLFPDSGEEFESWNSGSIKSTPKKEWEYVDSPFVEDSIRADVPPSKWKPKHEEYGGERGPIRVQVFLHAHSASDGETQFGDYKKAAQLDRSNPLWLHEDEVLCLLCVTPSCTLVGLARAASGPLL